MEKFYPGKDHAGSLGKKTRRWNELHVDKLVIPEISAPSTDPDTDTGWLYVKNDAGTSKLYFEEQAGGVTDLCAAGSTALDDIGDPDGDGSITCGTYAQTITSEKTNGDMFNIQGLGNFGDVSVVRIESKTGNPTDGTVLEVVAHDANVDPLVVSSSASASAFVVGQDGNCSMAGDLTVTGAIAAGSTAIDDIAAATGNQTLTLNGNGAGGVNICSVSTGGITLGDDVTVSDGKNVVIGEGTLTIDNDSADEVALTITSDATTAGGAIDITSGSTTGNVIKVTADNLGSGGAMILLDSDNTAADNFYLECYDGSADDLTIGQHGAVTIAGNASTDIITVTAGNVQVTAGNIDVDAGKIEVDCATDITSYIKRNQGTTTGPVLELEETDAAADNAVLLIDQNATAAASYGLEIDSAGGTCINVNPEATTGDGIVFNVPASYTGQLIKVSDTLVGTTGEGCVLDAKTTANLADGATMVRLDFDTGTMAGAHNGFMLSIDDDSVGVGTSYAVEINSNNNEALIVSAGKASFTEQIICTAGIDSDAGLDVDMATNADVVNITAAAADFAAGDSAVTIYGSAAGGQTNDSYLLRLARKADGDAQDSFILLQDNSTGAAANGDQKLKVGAEGTITMGAGTTGTGGAFVYSWEDLTGASEGVAASVVQVVTFVTTNGDGDEDAITLADGTVGQVKIFVTKVEGAGGDSYKITPAHMNGGTKITFDAVVGDGCTMIFDGTSWNIISNNGGVIS